MDMNLLSNVHAGLFRRPARFLGKLSVGEPSEGTLSLPSIKHIFKICMKRKNRGDRLFCVCKYINIRASILLFNIHSTFWPL
jgi:hypothetical protein